MSRKAVESLVTIGTPVDIPDEEAPMKKKDQVATDAQGRRRFHGAFTGGFSAGYFNTVGSKEGWTPSTFVSSRAQRAKAQQRAEDFMDEEDFADHGIAPKQVATTALFSNDSKRKPEAADGDSIRGFLEELTMPSGENIGTRLLRTMGWKDGQGIGPRVEARFETAHNTGAGVRGVDSHAAALGFTFAPRDAKIRAHEAKDNFFGIGYKKLDAGDHQMGTRDRQRSGGIGVGAFEAEDEDIYARDSLSNYDQTAGAAPKEHDGVGERRPRHRFRRKGDSQGLEGFVPATEVSAIGYKRYEPPPLPANFNPFHVFDGPGPAPAGKPPLPPPGLQAAAPAAPQPKVGGDTGRETRINLQESGEDAYRRRMGLGRSGPPVQPQRQVKAAEPRGQGATVGYTRALTAKERGDILGEERLPSRKAAAPQQQPQAQDHGAHAVPPQGLPPSASADKRAKPYMLNPAKQLRYDRFLAGHRVRAPGFSDLDYAREMQEFQKTSKWFKPMSKMMGNRFQEAKGSGSDASEAGGAATAAVDLSYDERKATAVKMKLFGHMTHDEVEWHPHRLLCKRLGIIDPYPKSGVVGTVAPSGSSRGSSARWSELGFADSPLHPVELAPKGAASTASGLAPGKPQSEAAQATARLFASLGEEPAEAAAPEPLPDRPSMDIFKAIFSDSSEEEEEEEGRKEGKNEKNADRMPPVSEKSPVPRRASPVPAGGPSSSTKAPSAIATGVVPAAQQAFAGRFAAVMLPEASPKTTDRQATPLVVGHTASGRAPDAARGEGPGALPVAKPAAVPVPRSAATAKAADKLELVYNHPLATNGGRRVSPEAEESDGVEDLWVEISRHNKQKEDRSRRDKERRRKRKKEKKKKHSSGSRERAASSAAASGRLPSDHELVARLQQVGGLQRLAPDRSGGRAGSPGHKAAAGGPVGGSSESVRREPQPESRQASGSGGPRRRTAADYM